MRHARMPAEPGPGGLRGHTTSPVERHAQRRQVLNRAARGGRRTGPTASHWHSVQRASREALWPTALVHRGRNRINATLVWLRHDGPTWIDQPDGKEAG